MARTAPAIEVDNLGTVFQQRGQAVTVHRGLNLRVPAGEVLAIVGASGSGKTALLRHLLGLTLPTCGTVKVLGQSPRQLGLRGASAQVGMLFQGGALFSAFSVLENIALPLRERGHLPPDLVRDAALLKLALVGLRPDDAHKLPAQLSGGMVKRVALARALIMDPPLLLLDEPTAGLDPAAAIGLCDLLRALQQDWGLTLVMVTHDVGTLLALGAQVAVLAEQQIVVHGPLPQVQALAHPFVREFFRGERAGSRCSSLAHQAGAS